MRLRLSLLFLAISLFSVSIASIAHASLIYLYDFPGSPGSGLATDQTNGQPTGATFGDFTRSTVGEAGGANDFTSDNWSLSGSLDPAIYEGFSISATPGFHLNLNSFTFDAKISGSGPVNVEAALFLNGSATAYATFDFAPNGTLNAYTFNFAALTDPNNVTSATLKFFGWNAANTGGTLLLDNVGGYGTISSVPEAAPLLPVILLFVCVLLEGGRYRRRPSRYWKVSIAVEPTSGTDLVLSK